MEKKGRAVKDEARTIQNFRDLRPKQSLRSTLRGLALNAASIVKRQSAPAVRLFYCHYVLDDQVKDFERKVLFLKSVGRFATDDEILHILRGDTAPEGNVFHLSFDDGFLNIIKNALPVLVRHEVPSTFFVPTAIIGADYDTVKRYCLVSTNYAGIMEMSSWDDLKHALDAGMNIGSHTRTHARFSAISGDRERLEDEILGSKHDIENFLGIECRHISWPYGKISDADDLSLRYVQEAGYETCFGAFRGRAIPGKTNAFYIPRHHFEPQWPDAHFRYFARGGREHA